MEKTDLNRQVGERIRAEIKRKGRTFTDVAKEAGLNRSSLSRIMQGERRASAAVLHALGRALGVPPGRFLGGDQRDEGGERADLQRGETVSEFLSACGDDLTGRERRVFEAMRERFGDRLRSERADWLHLRDTIRSELSHHGGGSPA